MVVLTEWKDSGYSPVGRMLVWHAEVPRSEPSTTKIRSASTLCNPTLQREGGRINCSRPMYSFSVAVIKAIAKSNLGENGL